LGRLLGLAAAVDHGVRGAGDTALVFVHGWCCDRSFWHRQVDAFSGDHRVVTIDLAADHATRQLE
jgi:pimeloyl-ACP methyl ester carboxylesterase